MKKNMTGKNIYRVDGLAAFLAFACTDDRGIARGTNGNPSLVFDDESFC